MRGSELTTILYVCETCRYSNTQQTHDGHKGGELFARELRRRLESGASTGIELRLTRCLMACNRHCTAHLRAPGKIGYVIGDFPPTPNSAETLLDYAGKYHRSEDGIVAYRSWPEQIKGHFIARIPPLEFDN